MNPSATLRPIARSLVSVVASQLAPAAWEYVSWLPLAVTGLVPATVKVPGTAAEWLAEEADETEAEAEGDLLDAAAEQPASPAISIAERDAAMTAIPRFRGRSLMCMHTSNQPGVSGPREPAQIRLVRQLTQVPERARPIGERGEDLLEGCPIIRNAPSGFMAKLSR